MNGYWPVHSRVHLTPGCRFLSYLNKTKHTSMPRNTLLLCAGIFFLNPVASLGQSLPRNPTTQQVVSYQQQEQKQWTMNQQPSNAVLLKTNPAVHTLQYKLNFKKEKEPAIILPGSKPYSLPAPTRMSVAEPSPAPATFRQPVKYRFHYNSWLKQEIRNNRNPVRASKDFASPGS